MKREKEREKWHWEKVKYGAGAGSWNTEREWNTKIGSEKVAKWGKKGEKTRKRWKTR